MIWKTAYLAAFLGGLALGVYSMLHGAERWRRRRSTRPSPVFNPTTVAALATGFGACGYLLVTRTSLASLIILIVSAATALAVSSGVTLLIAKWALRNPGITVHDDEEINGQVATVSRAIPPDGSGEITYFAWDKRHVLPARTVDGSSVAAGTEVVIELIENGVARVELWSVVEQRL